MSEAYIAKFVNDEILTLGGDAPALNRRTYRTEVYELIIGGTGVDNVIESTLSVTGRGVFNGLSAIGSRTRQEMRGFTVDVFVDGVPTATATSLNTGTTQERLHGVNQMRRLSPGGLHWLWTVVETEGLTPGIPFVNNLNIVIRRSTIEPTPILTFAAHLFLDTMATGSVVNQNSRHRRLLFTTGTGATVTINDNILGNTATIHAIGMGGEGARSNYPTANMGSSGGAGHNGEMRIDRIPLKRGDIVSVVLGTDLTHTTIDVTSAPRITLRRGAPGFGTFSQNTMMLPTTPEPSHIFEGRGRGGAGGFSPAGTHARANGGTGTMGRVVLDYEIE